MRISRSELAVTALGLAVAVASLALHALLGPPDTYWTIDNGGKALVLQQIRDGERVLPYAGSAIDPEFRYFPQPTTGAERYAVRRGPGMISQYNSPFVWMSWPFFATFGFAGITGLAALGAGLCVVLAGRLAQTRLACGRTALLTAALTALASPLLFYGSVFWEHTLVGALALGALLSLERKRFLSAGLLLGGACLLREEMLLLWAAALAGLAWHRTRKADWGKVAGGGSLGVGALALFHRVTAGSWTGLHVDVNRPLPFVNSGRAVQDLVFGTGGSGAPWWLLAGLFLLAVGLVRRSPALGARAAAVFALAAGAVAWMAWAFFPGSQDAALALIRSNSLVVFVPWALVAALESLRGRGRPPLADSIVLLFAVAFLVTVPARSITGIHPGPRMLLWPLVPVLAATLAGALVAAPRRSWLVLPAILAALAWNVRSLDLLAAKRTHSGRLLAAVASRSEPVVATSLFWLPTELPSLWASRRFHLLSSAADARDLSARLAAAGEKSMLVAEIPGTIPGPPTLSVRNPRFPEFSVDLHVVPLIPPASHTPQENAP